MQHITSPNPEHSHNLQSAITMLRQPATTTTFAKHVFRCSAPAVWNSKLKTVLDTDSVTDFKSRLMTFRFSRAFGLSSAHQHALKLRPNDAIQL